MKFPLSLLAVAASSLLAVPAAHCADTPLRHVLFFSQSAGFEHSVIKQEGGQPSHVEKVLGPLGPENHIEFTFTKDGRLFTPENIAKYDAFIFFTTGALTKPGNDKNPPMTAEGKAALLDAVHNGKGFVGTHSASDTFHTPGSPYQNNAQVDPYITMLGGEFITHNAQQKSRVTCADPKFPGLGGVKDGVEWLEEWYSLKNFAPDLHVLLVQQTDGMEGNAYRRPPFPETWAHLYGKGRVFYTSLAHREDTWLKPEFQQILLGGIHWAVGDVDSDITPNLTQVCPGSATNPVPPDAAVRPSVTPAPTASPAPAAH